MGFHAALQLLYQEEQRVTVTHSPDTKARTNEDVAADEDGFIEIQFPETSEVLRTIWQGEEVISFGHVTRLEKLIDKERFGHVRHASRRRAGICVMHWCLDKLFQKLASPALVHFAPQILVYDDYHERQRLLGGSAPSSRIVDLRSFDVGYERNGFPSQEKLCAHNKAVSLPPTDFATLIGEGNYHPVLASPIMWEACSVIADWLDEAEAATDPAWIALAEDPVSIALVRAWRCYLREVGRVGARALFLFPFC